MVDPGKLREALDSPYGVFSDNGCDFNEYGDVVWDAACELLALKENGQTVWWCEEHLCTGWGGGRAQWCHLRPFGDRQDPDHYDCRMVKASLHIHREGT